MLIILALGLGGSNGKGTIPGRQHFLTASRACSRPRGTLTPSSYQAGNRRLNAVLAEPRRLSLRLLQIPVMVRNWRYIGLLHF